MCVKMGCRKRCKQSQKAHVAKSCPRWMVSTRRAATPVSSVLTKANQGMSKPCFFNAATTAPFNAVICQRTSSWAFLALLALLFASTQLVNLPAMASMISSEIV